MPESAVDLFRRGYAHATDDLPALSDRAIAAGLAAAEHLHGAKAVRRVAERIPDQPADGHRAWLNTAANVLAAGMVVCECEPPWHFRGISRCIHRDETPVEHTNDFRTCIGCGDDIWPNEQARPTGHAGALCAICQVKTAAERAEHGDPESLVCCLGQPPTDPPPVLSSGSNCCGGETCAGKCGTVVASGAEAQDRADGGDLRVIVRTRPGIDGMTVTNVGSVTYRDRESAQAAADVLRRVADVTEGHEDQGATLTVHRLVPDGEAVADPHCGHWAEGDGPCCRCERPKWCPETGETPEALAELARAEREGCPA